MLTKIEKKPNQIQDSLKIWASNVQDKPIILGIKYKLLVNQMNHQQICKKTVY
jgi:hypothetical protein